MMMNLCDRGNRNQSLETGLEIREEDLLANRQQQNRRYHYPRHIRESEPRYYRQDRGLAAQNPPNIFVNSDWLVHCQYGRSCPIPWQKPEETRINDTDKVHFENIRHNLERRLASAKAQGDKNLLTLLEKESHQIAL